MIMVEDTRPPGRAGTNGGLSRIPRVVLDTVPANGRTVVSATDVPSEN